MIHQLKIAVLCTVVSAVCFAEAPKAEAKKGPNMGAKPPAGSSPTEVTELAARVAGWARENKNAAGLLAAAQMLDDAGSTAEKREKTSEGGTESTKEARQALSSKSLRAEADALAANNKKLKDAIAVVSAAAPKSRGAMGGPKRTCDKVLAGSTDMFRIRFEGVERAEIALLGDGDTDLDLSVYDENDNLIAKDDGTSDRAYVRFLPAWTGIFNVKIKNLGSVYNEYCLLTN